MSTNSTSEDLDALLGADRSTVISRPMRVIACAHGYAPSSAAPGRRDPQETDPHRNWKSKTEVTANGSGGSNSGRQQQQPPPPTSDRAGTCRPQASPVSQQDLIELASSTEDFSVCSTSSEYKSCDESEHRKDPAATTAAPPTTDSGVISTIQIVLDPVESEVHCGGNEFLDYNILPSDPVVSDSTRSRYLSPRLDDDCSCCAPEEEPFIIGRFPQCPSAAQLSITSSNSDPTIPTCRICHLPAGDSDNLISPCRCAGTMQYIHNGCLMKWLDVSSRKSKRPPSCELCLYQYHRHKKFKASHWQFPQCTLRDKILHSIFFISLMTMIGAATVTILCFKQDKGGGGRSGGDKNRLTNSEIITLVCGVLFFVAFFLAMYVEVKARSTIYKIIVDFLYLNQQWYIDEYDKKTDIQSMTV